MAQVSQAQVDQARQAAESAFPELGERARKATEYVLGGRVQRAADVGGQDRWVAQGSPSAVTGIPRRYELSIAGGWCQCPDAQYQAPRDHKGRMLCKHMLSAMYLVRAGVSRPPTATEVAQRIFGQAENEVRLYVREKWTGTTSKTQTNELRGYRIDGGDRVDLAEPVDISAGNMAWWNVVEEHGWQVRLKTPSQGGLHCHYMEPAPVAVEDWPQAEADADLDGLWE